MASFIVTFTQIIALVRKELLALIKEPASRALLIAPAFLQALLYGYGATYDLTHVPYAVLDQSRSAASTELLARIDGTGVFVRAATLTSPRQIAEMVDAEKALLVLSIPPDFAARLGSGQPAPLQLILDGRNSSTAGSAASHVGAIVAAYNASLGTGAPGIRVERRAWFNPNLESQWFIVPGIIALLAMIVTLVVTALSVAREREAGTFDQLLVTPLRPVEILIGKAVPGLIVGVGEASLIILVAVFWFRIPLVGSLATLYPALVIYVLSIIGVGLMISSFSATLQQALLGSFLFIVPAVILSGFATPIANMPAFMQKLTYLDPMRYFLTIVRRVFLEGAGLEYFWHDIWPMSVIAVVTLATATWLFRHRMY